MAAAAVTPRPDVAVAVCTRGRPEMLRATLASLASLELGDINCRFIIVENNESVTVGPITKELAETVGAEHVVTANEPRLGIAHARNRALDIATEMGADALAFIDDDEVADRRWLSVLLQTAQDRELHLVGGPVRLLPAPENAGRGEQMIWRGIHARFRGNEATGRRLTAQGRDGRITIVTSNWLADLAFVRQHGLRFDGTLGLSSGSDTDFHRALRAAGGRTGWAPQAIVSEFWPRERLTLAYQFRRGRDQALARQYARHPRRSAKAAASALVTAGLKVLGGAARMLQAPFDGGASLVRAARAFGAAAGLLAYLRGRRSRHYDTPTGR